MVRTTVGRRVRIVLIIGLIIKGRARQRTAHSFNPESFSIGQLFQLGSIELRQTLIQRLAPKFPESKGSFDVDRIL